jgi:hypothetical protein
MARPLRIEFKGALYRIISGGNDRHDIFLGDDDYEIFLGALEEFDSNYKISRGGYGTKSVSGLLQRSLKPLLWMREVESIWFANKKLLGRG